MTLVTTPPTTEPQPRSTSAPGPRTEPRTGRRERRQRHRRLVRQDRLSARMAELHRVAEILGRAEALVADGWVQGAWFGYPGPSGPRVSHLPGGLSAASAAAADRFCLVAAVQAATATGPGTRMTRAERPLADRAVDTAWRALADAEPVAGGVPHLPPPHVGALRRLDLTRWNDAKGRTPHEVRGLLRRAVALVEEDRGRAAAALAATA